MPRVPLLPAVVVVCGVLLLAVGASLVASGVLDAEAPQLRATLPSQDVPYRGEVPLHIDVADAAPGLAGLWVRLDGGPERALPLDRASLTLPIDTASLEDGPHTLSLRVWDGAWFPNTSSQELGFVTDNTMPVLEIAEASLRVTQGRTLALVVRTAEPLARLEATVFDKGRRFYPVAPGLWRALVGVAIEQPAGTHMIRLEGEDASGNIAHAELPLQVEAGTFPDGGFIRLNPQQIAARQDEQAKAAMRKEREDVYRHRDPIQRWVGVMRRPTQGRRTSPFGRYRTYSDGRRSHHSGTDLADVAGTPVAAAAAGLVRQAGWQHIFGNVVILDHGQGVSTSYNHLSAVRVQVGAQVEAGEVVGEVGSTGQSTGPHLHWGLVVDGVAVDAEEWLARDFSPDEYAQLRDASQVEGGAVSPRARPTAARSE